MYTSLDQENSVSFPCLVVQFPTQIQIPIYFEKKKEEKKAVHLAQEVFVCFLNSLQWWTGFRVDPWTVREKLPFHRTPVSPIIKVTIKVIINLLHYLVKGIPPLHAKRKLYFGTYFYGFIPLDIYKQACYAVAWIVMGFSYLLYLYTLILYFCEIREV